MSKIRSDYIALFDLYVKPETDAISEADKILIIETATRIYSQYKSLIKYYDITGDDSSQSWDVPDDWENEYSELLKIEYPQGELPPEYDQEEQIEWDIYYDQDNEKWLFRLIEDTPSASETVRLKYTIRHTLNETTNTIPDCDFEIVSKIAASEGCKTLAAYYGKTSDQSIEADVVNYSNKSSEYRHLAKMYEEQWKELLGISDKGIDAGSTWVDWDIKSTLDNGDLLFHGVKTR